jgi:hypothetical protein
LLLLVSCAPLGAIDRLSDDNHLAPTNPRGQATHY